MKKKTLRIVMIIVIITLTLSMVASATITSSDYISATSAWITRDGDTIEVNFYIVGVGMMDKIGVKYIYLYELNDGIWGLVGTYSYTNLVYAATLMDTNSTIKSGYIPYSGSASKQYYASCWFYAEKNGGSDTVQQNAY